MLHTVTFSIPKDKLCKINPIKTKVLSDLIPGDISTYIYKNEEDYYNEYRSSYFAITKKKAGWDCMRHYEILANKCIPYFIDIEKCPKNSMSRLPIQLLIEANRLYEKFRTDITKVDIDEYTVLQKKLFEYTCEHLTTDKMAEYILEKANLKNVKRVLYLSGDTTPDYLRCLTLHGFKTLLGYSCHDYPNVPHIYKSANIDYSSLYGKGITYANLLGPEFRDDSLDSTIIHDILSKRYDMIVYGSYHRGMFYYDLICQIYPANKIILLCGEDEHICDYDTYLKKGHHVFLRELTTDFVA
jgi:hypothetical protein